MLGGVGESMTKKRRAGWGGTSCALPLASHGNCTVGSRSSCALSSEFHGICVSVFSQILLNLHHLLLPFCIFIAYIPKRFKKKKKNSILKRSSN